MTFNSAGFPLVFLVLFLAYFGLGSRHRTRLSLLLAGNLLFYATWSVSFVPYLLATGIFDFLIARAIDRMGSPRKRAVVLGLSMGANLGMLFVFKFLDPLLSALPGHSPFGLVAPLGISFYTFQSMSYTIDVYRRVCRPKASLLEFLASLTFLPHMLAGPIIRASFFLPQFERLRTPTEGQLRRGCVLIAIGLFKKSLADLAGPIVQTYYDFNGSLGPLPAWTGALAFATQVYGDFSGYSDMASGLAWLLGFELPPNFQLPYLSRSPMEFWRRWHISLSTWFRDYVFYPLAIGPLRRHVYFNLFLVMVLAGVWHGAGWNFFLFGVYHGLLLAGAQWLSTRTGRRAPFPPVVQIALTFYLVLLGQAVFRVPLAHLPAVFRGLHFLSVGTRPVSPVTFFAMIAALLVGHGVDFQVAKRRNAELSPRFAYTVSIAAFAFALFAGTPAKFIYFKF